MILSDIFTVIHRNDLLLKKCSFGVIFTCVVSFDRSYFPLWAK